MWKGESVNSSEPRPHVSRPCALIVGASGGMGPTIIEALLDDGMGVIGWDVALDCHVARERLGPRYDMVHWRSVDVSDQSQIEAAFQDVNVDWSTLTAVVNLVASPRVPCPLLEMSVSDWDEVMAVNLRGVYLCLSSAARLMVEYGTAGRIVNLSSAAGIRPLETLSAYSVSKSAIIALTRVAARELGVHGITVNSIAPGPIRTAASDEMRRREGAARQSAITSLDASIPVGHRGLPADVVRAVRFLISYEASFITGSTVVVDGGLTA